MEGQRIRRKTLIVRCQAAVPWTNDRTQMGSPPIPRIDSLIDWTTGKVNFQPLSQAVHPRKIARTHTHNVVH